jgi:hypothetical protein
MPINIHGVDIYHNDNVFKGMDHLKSLPEKEFKEILEDARTSGDRDTHFRAYIGGRNLDYVLIHNNGKYELRPKI